MSVEDIQAMSSACQVVRALETKIRSLHMLKLKGIRTLSQFLHLPLPHLP